MSNAVAAFGTLLKLNGTTVAEIKKIGGIDISLDTVETTSHDSAGAWAECVATILRQGEISIEGNYLPGNATHKNAAGGLIGQMTNRAIGTWTIVYPSSPTVTQTFPGYVVKFHADAPFDGELTFTASIKPSGAPTLI